MYPSPFIYVRAKTLTEAEDHFVGAEDPAFLSGGHTLLPAMKNRLATPSHLIDLRAIPELHGIRHDGDNLIVGAATTHANVAASAVVQGAIPALAALAGSIADIQVRNMGTIGGSVANNDPSADYPSAVLGLGATVVTQHRRIPADHFLTGLFSTALEPGEIVTGIAFPIPQSCGYAKLCSQASRYAVAGVFVAVADRVRVAVTGAGSDGVFRWMEAEDRLTERFHPDALLGLLPDEDFMASDLNGSAAYRASLVAEMTRRAVSCQGGADIS
jgi:aerobic carbon-monoxide dehydrogenase medium subunit